MFITDFGKKIEHLVYVINSRIENTGGYDATTLLPKIQPGARPPTTYGPIIKKIENGGSVTPTEVNTVLIGGYHALRPLGEPEPLALSYAQDVHLIRFLARLFPQADDFGRQDWVDIWELDLGRFERAIPPVPEGPAGVRHVAHGAQAYRPVWRPGRIGGLVPHFDHFIDERLTDFTGRKSVIDAVTDFVDGSKHKSGYFLLTAYPGWGKSSVASYLARHFRGSFFHANSRTLAVVEQRKLLESAIDWMAARYDLQRPKRDSATGDDALQFQQLITDCSRNIALRRERLPSIKAIHAEPKRGAPQADIRAWQDCRQHQWQYRMVMIIDALDEMEPDPFNQPRFPAGLPQALPDDVFVIITCRANRVPNSLRPRCPFARYDAETNAPENANDITTYVNKRIEMPGKLQAFHDKWRKARPNDDLMGHILEKSEGNFMYVASLFAVIEHPPIINGVAREFTADNLIRNELPQGLSGYYEWHWNLMKVQDETAWSAHKIWIIGALRSALGPIGPELIARFARPEDGPTPTSEQIWQTLQEWDQFLYRHPAEPSKNLPERYSWYHSTFRDFLDQRATSVSPDAKALLAVPDRIVEEMKITLKPGPIPDDE